MKHLKLALIVALSTLAACAWWMAGRPGLNRIDQLVFSHETHKDNDVECETCHAGILAAADLSTAFTPTESVCLDCHERDNCAMCHSDVASRRPRGPHHERIAFSHAAHKERAKDGCPQCHFDVEGSTALPIRRPAMDTCLECHNHAQDYAQARCLHCHPTLQELPLRAVAEYDHGGDWASRHGAQARTQGEGCLQCHAQTQCSECHSRVAPATNARLFPEAVTRSLIHRGDWLSTHPIEARADGETCLRCHDTTGFCEQCHRASGVAPARAGGVVPHPPGYAVRGGAQFHGDEARLHIETCAACHDQGAASNCVQCHREGGVGGNPHPAGFRDRYEKSDRGKGMCMTCHPNR